MEIIGRLTANAKTHPVKEGRTVVHFSVAINDRYRPQGSDRQTTLTTYVNCSYWINPGIAPYLTKGQLVELSGRIGVNAWKNALGEPKASLTMHVNQIKLHGKAGNPSTELIPAAEDITAPGEDLPF